MKRLKTWFKGLSKAGKITTIAIASFLAIGTIGNITQPSQSVSTIPETVKTAPQIQEKPEVKKPVVKIETVVKKEGVPFTSSTVNDSALPQGQTQLRTPGINGERTITYEVTYADDVEMARREVGNSITIPPTNEVIAKGTKVAVQPQANCPNGTYRNSDGNTVCRPYASSSVPADATAQCKDGTYSSSQNRRGTCSGHGGVARWL